MESPNILALILSTLTPMIMGFIWYHPKVFGDAWMKSIGLTSEDLKKTNMGVVFGVSLVLSFMLSLFMLVNVDSPGQEGEFDSFGHGAFHGGLVGMMVAVPVLITNSLFERRSWKTMMINAAYWVVTIAIMGGILDALNHWPNEAPLPG